MNQPRGMFGHHTFLKSVVYSWELLASCEWASMLLNRSQSFPLQKEELQKLLLQNFHPWLLCHDSRSALSAMMFWTLWPIYSPWPTYFTCKTPNDSTLLIKVTSHASSKYCNVKTAWITLYSSKITRFPWYHLIYSISNTAMTCALMKSGTVIQALLGTITQVLPIFQSLPTVYWKLHN